MKTVLLFISIFITLLPFTARAEYSIAIVPLGPFDSSLIASIIPDIKRQFADPKVVVCKTIALPPRAWYKPRNRYRAEILLDFLDSLRNGRCTKILGLTQQDISTTKGPYEDWGIFGFGAVAAGPCVVSVFRLHKNASEALFKERFAKVVIHELGHTYGLDHCPNETCIMADYKGTIKSLDLSRKDFCASCGLKIKKAIQFLSAG